MSIYGRMKKLAMLMLYSITQCDETLRNMSNVKKLITERYQNNATREV